MSSGFVSEADLLERRRVQNELWQSTRKDGDPELPPEEEPITDHRTLFEKLQEQKLKKQEDWEEAHKLKNMVRGLEDDEVDFLEFVDNTKIQQEKRIRIAENSALKEYRKKVAERNLKAQETEVLSEFKTEKKAPSSSSSRKGSQMSLLAGAIKRKSSPKSEEQHKKHKPDLTPAETSCKTVSSTSNENVEKGIKESESSDRNVKSGLQCVAVLPGLGVYTDSSDSDNSDSDSDVATPTIRFVTDLTGRLIKLQGNSKEGCC